MSTPSHGIPSEDQINAYLDGELSPEERDLVDAAASANPQLRERLQLDAAINDGLQQLFGAALEGPVPSRLVNALGPRPWPWWQRISAAAACVCLGVLIGWHLSSLNVAEQLARARPVSTEAAAAHAVYTRENRHTVEVRSDEREHLDRWLSKRLSHKLAAPDLRGHGLTLIGGRLLADAGQPAALYMYESADGERITIYVRGQASGSAKTAPQSQPPAALHFAKDRGLEVAYWAEHDMSYAITGKIARARLQELANTAHKQL
jgi:anti-sigma factor RsiW